MVVEVKRLKPTPNEITLDRIRKRASDEYQRRVPEATKGGMKKAIEALSEFGPIRNEMVKALVNRIGLVDFKNNSWDNPLREFQRGMLTSGDTVEEVKTGLIKAKTYDPDRDSLERELFGTAPIESDSSFHTINRQESYKITINEPLLQRAILEPMGLTTFASQLMEAPSTSDNWDQFLLTCALFPHYEANGGFYKINVPDITSFDSTEEDAKQALRKMRAAADNLTFMSTKYNAAGMPAAAKRSEILLFVTPEFNAAIDVEALAAAFNIGSAQLHGRIVPIPVEQFGIDGVQAIMTTPEFFQIWDTLFQTTSLFNPETLGNNFWLHHHQIISASRFAPAIMFTTKPGDEEIIIRQPVISVSTVKAYNRDGAEVTEVVRGEVFQFDADAVTEPNDGVNDGVIWSVSGNKSNVTHISATGVLYVAPNDAAASLTVTAKSSWTDPENPQNDAKSASLTVTVAGDSSSTWPLVRPVTGITVKGVAVEPAFAAGTFAYTVEVEGGTATLPDVAVSGPDYGDLEITLNGAGDVITIKSPSSPGDPVYTVTVNEPTP